VLDTHVALWAIAKAGRLPGDVAALIADPANEIIVSAVSVWEISIKHALSRGRPDDIMISGARALTFFRDAGYDLLSVSPEHAAAVNNCRACIPILSTVCLSRRR
jgi:PIN domain nuclease of toxin-antitoxin system